MPHDVVPRIPGKSKETIVDIAQRREQVATWLEEQVAERRFKTLRNVEHMALADLRQTPVAGTLFEAIEGALLEHGVKTNGTVGSIMDVLALTQENVNYLACFCHNGDTTLGLHVAGGLRSVRI